jgi:hypothetical protein
LDLIQWLPTAAAGGLAFVVWAKLDNVEKKIDHLLRTELRTMDVRVSLIEKHIWPDRARQGQ